MRSYESLAADLHTLRPRVAVVCGHATHSTIGGARIADVMHRILSLPDPPLLVLLVGCNAGSARLGHLAAATAGFKETITVCYDRVVSVGDLEPFRRSLPLLEQLIRSSAASGAKPPLRYVVKYALAMGMVVSPLARLWESGRQGNYCLTFPLGVCVINGTCNMHDTTSRAISIAGTMEACGLMKEAVQLRRFVALHCWTAGEGELFTHAFLDVVQALTAIYRHSKATHAVTWLRMIMAHFNAKLRLKHVAHLLHEVRALPPPSGTTLSRLRAGDWKAIADEQFVSAMIRGLQASIDDLPVQHLYSRWKDATDAVARRVLATAIVALSDKAYIYLPYFHTAKDAPDALVFKRGYRDKLDSARAAGLRDGPPIPVNGLVPDFLYYNCAPSTDDWVDLVRGVSTSAVLLSSPTVRIGQHLSMGRRRWFLNGDDGPELTPPPIAKPVHFSSRDLACVLRRLAIHMFYQHAAIDPRYGDHGSKHLYNVKYEKENFGRESFPPDHKGITDHAWWSEVYASVCDPDAAGPGAGSAIRVATTATSEKGVSLRCCRFVGIFTPLKSAASADGAAIEGAESDLPTGLQLKPLLVFNKGSGALHDAGIQASRGILYFTDTHYGDCFATMCRKGKGFYDHDANDIHGGNTKARTAAGEFLAARRVFPFEALGRFMAWRTSSGGAQLQFFPFDPERSATKASGEHGAWLTSRLPAGGSGGPSSRVQLSVTVTSAEMVYPS
jgi:hypothetical protein